ncbi:MAG: MFS transporter [candidate division NC10 bacterium]|nr:MFS transporter [candidate division NC10 bacterium]
MAPRAETPSRSYAYYALGVLFLINLLNYIDRQVLYAVFPQVKGDLHLSDTQLGTLASAFMIVYLSTAPIAGLLGDRLPRKAFISLGVGLWSLATVFSGLARTFAELLMGRSLVGVGEASYGTVSPTLIADYFPRERRGMALSFFYMAIPVGSAIGYVLGGILAADFGWRAAFFMVGAPGLIMGLVAWLLMEPRRGAMDEASSRTFEGVEEVRPTFPMYLSLLRTRSYLFDVLAMAAMTFALGGLAAWLPSYLVRVRGMGIAQANVIFGGITLVTGVAGTLIGGWLGDFLLRYTRKSYFLVSGCGLLLSVPFAVLVFLSPSLQVSFAAMFLGEFLIFLNTGPLNAIIVNVSHPAVRAGAFALNIFVIHILGDAISPTILGYLSDLYGLKTALLMTPLALALGGILCLVGMRSLEADMEKAKKAPTNSEVPIVDDPQPGQGK